MKKLNLMVLTALTLISGCKQNVSKDYLVDNNLTLITPTGAPVVAFAKYLESTNYDTNNVVSNIAADMIAANHDLVVIDVVGGLNAISKGADYSLASILTFGNFYIYATGNDDNGVMEEEDTIVGFGSAQSTPNYIFEEIYNLSIDMFVPSAANTLAVATSGEYNGETVDYIMSAEPVITNIKANAPQGEVYANLQEEWLELHDSPILGAALFVKNATYSKKSEAINTFLGKIKTDINSYIEDYTNLEVVLNEYDADEMKLKTEIPLPLALNVIKNGNAINLGYLGYDDEQFVSTLNTYLPLVKASPLSDNAYLK